MATNLRIGYPVIPLAASSVSLLTDVGIAGPTEATGTPITNAFGGNWTDIFRANDGYTNLLLYFTLASTYSADFFWLGDCKILKGEGATRLLLAHHTSNSYGSSTRELDLNPLSGETLYGPASTDLFYTFTATAARQYWWVNILGPSTTNYAFSKLMFGTGFDMGRDPDEKGGFVTSRTRPAGSQRRAAYKFEISWSGVSYAKAVEFYQLVSLKRRHQPFILYTTAYHELMNNHRCVFGRFTEVSSPPVVTGVCDVSAVFEELV